MQEDNEMDEFEQVELAQAMSLIEQEDEEMELAKAMSMTEAAASVSGLGLNSSSSNTWIPAAHERMQGNTHKKTTLVRRKAKMMGMSPQDQDLC